MHWPAKRRRINSKTPNENNTNFIGTDSRLSYTSYSTMYTPPMYTCSSAENVRSFGAEFRPQRQANYFASIQGVRSFPQGTYPSCPTPYTGPYMYQRFSPDTRFFSPSSMIPQDNVVPVLGGVVPWGHGEDPPTRQEVTDPRSCLPQFTNNYKQSKETKKQRKDTERTSSDPSVGAQKIARLRLLSFSFVKKERSKVCTPTASPKYEDTMIRHKPAATETSKGFYRAEDVKSIYGEVVESLEPSSDEDDEQSSPKTAQGLSSGIEGRTSRSSKMLSSKDSSRRRCRLKKKRKLEQAQKNSEKEPTVHSTNTETSLTEKDKLKDVETQTKLFEDAQNNRREIEDNDGESPRSTKKSSRRGHCCLEKERKIEQAQKSCTKEPTVHSTNTDKSLNEQHYLKDDETQTKLFEDAEHNRGEIEEGNDGRSPRSTEMPYGHHRCCLKNERKVEQAQRSYEKKVTVHSTNTDNSLTEQNKLKDDETLRNSLKDAKNTRQEMKEENIQTMESTYFTEESDDDTTTTDDINTTVHCHLPENELNNDGTQTNSFEDVRNNRKEMKEESLRSTYFTKQRDNTTTTKDILNTTVHCHLPEHSLPDTLIHTLEIPKTGMATGSIQQNMFVLSFPEEILRSALSKMNVEQQLLKSEKSETLPEVADAPPIMPSISVSSHRSVNTNSAFSKKSVNYEQPNTEHSELSGVLSKSSSCERLWRDDQSARLSADDQKRYGQVLPKYRTLLEHRHDPPPSSHGLVTTSDHKQAAETLHGSVVGQKSVTTPRKTESCTCLPCPDRVVQTKSRQPGSQPSQEYITEQKCEDIIARCKSELRQKGINNKETLIFEDQKKYEEVITRPKPLFQQQRQTSTGECSGASRDALTEKTNNANQFEWFPRDSEMNSDDGNEQPLNQSGYYRDHTEGEWRARSSVPTTQMQGTYFQISPHRNDQGSEPGVPLSPALLNKTGYFQDTDLPLSNHNLHSGVGWYCVPVPLDKNPSGPNQGFRNINEDPLIRIKPVSTDPKLTEPAKSKSSFHPPDLIRASFSDSTGQEKHADSNNTLPIGQENIEWALAESTISLIKETQTQLEKYASIYRDLCAPKLREQQQSSSPAQSKTQERFHEVKGGRKCVVTDIRKTMASETSSLSFQDDRLSVPISVNCRNKEYLKKDQNVGTISGQDRSHLTRETATPSSHEATSFDSESTNSIDFAPETNAAEANYAPVEYITNETDGKIKSATEAKTNAISKAQEIQDTGKQKCTKAIKIVHADGLCELLSIPESDLVEVITTCQLTCNPEEGESNDAETSKSSFSERTSPVSRYKSLNNDLFQRKWKSCDSVRLLQQMDESTHPYRSVLNDRHQKEDSHTCVRKVSFQTLHAAYPPSKSDENGTGCKASRLLSQPSSTRSAKSCSLLSTAYSSPRSILSEEIPQYADNSSRQANISVVKRDSSNVYFPTLQQSLYKDELVHCSKTISPILVHSPTRIKSSNSSLPHCPTKHRLHKPCTYDDNISPSDGRFSTTCRGEQDRYTNEFSKAALMPKRSRSAGEVKRYRPSHRKITRTIPSNESLSSCFTRTSNCTSRTQSSTTESHGQEDKTKHILPHGNYTPCSCGCEPRPMSEPRLTLSQTTDLSAVQNQTSISGYEVPPRQSVHFETVPEPSGPGNRTAERSLDYAHQSALHPTSEPLQSVQHFMPKPSHQREPVVPAFPEPQGKQPVSLVFVPIPTPCTPCPPVPCGPCYPQSWTRETQENQHRSTLRRPERDVKYTKETVSETFDTLRELSPKRLATEGPISGEQTFISKKSILKPVSDKFSQELPAKYNSRERILLQEHSGHNANDTAVKRHSSKESYYQPAKYNSRETIPLQEHSRYNASDAVVKGYSFKESHDQRAKYTSSETKPLQEHSRYNASDAVVKAYSFKESHDQPAKYKSSETKPLQEHSRHNVSDTAVKRHSSKEPHYQAVKYKSNETTPLQEHSRHNANATAVKKHSAKESHYQPAKCKSRETIPLQEHSRHNASDTAVKRHSSKESHYQPTKYKSSETTPLQEHPRHNANDNALKRHPSKESHHLRHKPRRHSSDESQQHSSDESQQHSSDESQQHSSDGSQQHSSDGSQQHSSDESQQHSTDESQQRSSDESQQHSSDESQQLSPEESKHHSSEESLRHSPEKSKHHSQAEPHQHHELPRKKSSRGCCWIRKKSSKRVKCPKGCVAELKERETEERVREGSQVLRRNSNHSATENNAKKIFYDEPHHRHESPRKCTWKPPLHAKKKTKPQKVKCPKKSVAKLQGRESEKQTGETSSDIPTNSILTADEILSSRQSYEEPHRSSHGELPSHHELRRKYSSRPSVSVKITPVWKEVTCPQIYVPKLRDRIPEKSIGVGRCVSPKHSRHSATKSKLKRQSFQEPPQSSYEGTRRLSKPLQSSFEEQRQRSSTGPYQRSYEDAYRCSDVEPEHNLYEDPHHHQEFGTEYRPSSSVPVHLRKELTLRDLNDLEEYFPEFRDRISEKTIRDSFNFSKHSRQSAIESILKRQSFEETRQRSYEEPPEGFYEDPRHYSYEEQRQRSNENSYQRSRMEPEHYSFDDPRQYQEFGRNCRQRPLVLVGKEPTLHEAKGPVQYRDRVSEKRLKEGSRDFPKDLRHSASESVLTRQSFDVPRQPSYEDTHQCSYMEPKHYSSDDLYRHQEFGRKRCPNSYFSARKDPTLQEANGLSESFLELRNQISDKNMREGSRNFPKHSRHAAIESTPRTQSFEEIRHHSHQETRQGSPDESRRPSYVDTRQSSYEEPRTRSYEGRHQRSYMRPEHFSSDGLYHRQEFGRKYRPCSSFSVRKDTTLQETKSLQGPLPELLDQIPENRIGQKSCNFPKHSRNTAMKSTLRRQSFKEPRHYCNEETRQRSYDETRQRSYDETRQRSYEDTRQPSYEDTRQPSYEDTRQPSYEDTRQPSYEDTRQPSYEDTRQPSYEDTRQPSYEETRQPSYEETHQPSYEDARQRSHKETHQRSYVEPGHYSSVDLHQHQDFGRKHCPNSSFSGREDTTLEATKGLEEYFSELPERSEKKMEEGNRKISKYSKQSSFEPKVSSHFHEQPRPRHLSCEESHQRSNELRQCLPKEPFQYSNEEPQQYLSKETRQRSSGELDYYHDIPRKDLRALPCKTTKIPISKSTIYQGEFVNKLQDQVSEEQARESCVLSKPSKHSDTETTIQGNYYEKSEPSHEICKREKTSAVLVKVNAMPQRCHTVIYTAQFAGIRFLQLIAVAVALGVALEYRERYHDPQYKRIHESENELKDEIAKSARNQKQPSKHLFVPNPGPTNQTYLSDVRSGDQHTGRDQVEVFEIPLQRFFAPSDNFTESPVVKSKKYEKNNILHGEVTKHFEVRFWHFYKPFITPQNYAHVPQRFLEEVTERKVVSHPKPQNISHLPPASLDDDFNLEPKRVEQLEKPVEYKTNITPCLENEKFRARSAEMPEQTASLTKKPNEVTTRSKEPELETGKKGSDTWIEQQNLNPVLGESQNKKCILQFLEREITSQNLKNDKTVLGTNTSTSVQTENDRMQNEKQDIVKCTTRIHTKSAVENKVPTEGPHNNTTSNTTEELYKTTINARSKIQSTLTRLRINRPCVSINTSLTCISQTNPLSPNINKPQNTKPLPKGPSAHIQSSLVITQIPRVTTSMQSSKHEAAHPTTQSKKTTEITTTVIKMSSEIHLNEMHYRKSLRENQHEETNTTEVPEFSTEGKVIYTIPSVVNEQENLPEITSNQTKVSQDATDISTQATTEKRAPGNIAVSKTLTFMSPPIREYITSTVITRSESASSKLSPDFQHPEKNMTGVPEFSTEGRVNFTIPSAEAVEDETLPETISNKTQAYRKATNISTRAVTKKEAPGNITVSEAVTFISPIREYITYRATTRSESISSQFSPDLEHSQHSLVFYNTANQAVSPSSVTVPIFLTDKPISSVESVTRENDGRLDMPISLPSPAASDNERSMLESPDSSPKNGTTYNVNIQVTGCSPQTSTAEVQQTITKTTSSSMYAGTTKTQDIYSKVTNLQRTKKDYVGSITPRKSSPKVIMTLRSDINQISTTTSQTLTKLNFGQTTPFLMNDNMSTLKLKPVDTITVSLSNPSSENKIPFSKKDDSHLNLTKKPKIDDDHAKKKNTPSLFKVKIKKKSRLYSPKTGDINKHHTKKSKDVLERHQNQSYILRERTLGQRNASERSSITSRSTAKRRRKLRRYSTTETTIPETEQSLVLKTFIFHKFREPRIDADEKSNSQYIPNLTSTEVFHHRRDSRVVSQRQSSPLDFRDITAADYNSTEPQVASEKDSSLIHSLNLTSTTDHRNSAEFQGAFEWNPLPSNTLNLISTRNSDSLRYSQVTPERKSASLDALNFVSTNQTFKEIQTTASPLTSSVIRTDKIPSREMKNLTVDLNNRNEEVTNETFNARTLQNRKVADLIRRDNHNIWKFFDFVMYHVVVFLLCGYGALLIQQILTEFLGGCNPRVPVIMAGWENEYIETLLEIYAKEESCIK